MNLKEIFECFDFNTIFTIQPVLIHCCCTINEDIEYDIECQCSDEFIQMTNILFIPTIKTIDIEFLKELKRNLIQYCALFVTFPSKTIKFIIKKENIDNLHLITQNNTRYGGHSTLKSFVFTNKYINEPYGFQHRSNSNSKSNFKHEDFCSENCECHSFDYSLKIKSIVNVTDIVDIVNDTFINEDLIDESGYHDISYSNKYDKFWKYFFKSCSYYVSGNDKYINTYNDQEDQETHETHETHEDMNEDNISDCIYNIIDRLIYKINMKFVD